MTGASSSCNDISSIVGKCSRGDLRSQASELNSPAEAEKPPQRLKSSQWLRPLFSVRQGFQSLNARLLRCLESPACRNQRRSLEAFLYPASCTGKRKRHPQARWQTATSFELLARCRSRLQRIAAYSTAASDAVSLQVVAVQASPHHDAPVATAFEATISPDPMTLLR